MKKMLSFILVAAILIMSSTTAFAVGRTEPTNIVFTALKAEKAPVLDGKIGATEWKGVKKFTLNKDNAFNWTNDIMKMSIDYYFMWDSKALYGAAVVKGDDIAAYCRDGQLAMNNFSDALQVSIFPDYKTTDKTAVWYTIGLKEDGNLSTYQHNYAEKVLDSVKGKVVGHKDGTDKYTVEYMIPWSTISGAKQDKQEYRLPEFTAKEGMEMRMIVAMLDGDYVGYTAFKSGGEKFDVVAYDKLVLAPAVQTASEEKTAEAEAAAETNPKTGDANYFIYVFAAIVSLFIMVVIKRKSPVRDRT